MIKTKKFKEHKNKRLKKLLSVTAFVLLTGLILSKIQISGLGAEVAALEKNDKLSHDELRDNSENLMNYSSLSDYQKKVEQMGFKKTTSLIYLHESETFAKLP